MVCLWLIGIHVSKSTEDCMKFTLFKFVIMFICLCILLMLLFGSHLTSTFCSSCLSFSSSSLLENAPTPLVPTTVNGVTKVYESTESLTSHRLRGAVHALSAITRAKDCEDVRIAIGDDRLVSRKVAQLLRARAIPTHEAEKEAPPYDEPLAASACLILEACVDDTVLAENLIGTTVMTDLLKLIKVCFYVVLKHFDRIFLKLLRGLVCSTRIVSDEICLKSKGSDWLIRPYQLEIFAFDLDLDLNTFEWKCSFFSYVLS